MVTSLAAGMRSAALAAYRYGAKVVSSRALMTSVGTVSSSSGNRSAARFETKPSKTAPSRLGLKGKQVPSRGDRLGLRRRAWIALRDPDHP
jgi:hypothetical protein